MAKGGKIDIDAQEAINQIKELIHQMELLKKQVGSIPKKIDTRFSGDFANSKDMARALNGHLSNLSAPLHNNKISAADALAQMQILDTGDINLKKTQQEITKQLASAIIKMVSRAVDDPKERRNISNKINRDVADGNYDKLMAHYNTYAKMYQINAGQPTPEEREYTKQLAIAKRYQNTPEYREFMTKRLNAYANNGDAAIMNAYSKAMTLGINGEATFEKTVAMALGDTLASAIKSTEPTWSDFLLNAGMGISKGFQQSFVNWNKGHAQSAAYEKELSKTAGFQTYLADYEKTHGTKKGANARDFYYWDMEERKKFEAAEQAKKKKNKYYRPKTYQSSFRDAQEELQTDRSALKRIGKAGGMLNVGLLAVNALSDAIVKLGEASVQAYEKIQSLQTQLSVVYDSDINAKQAFSEIEAYAKKSPFGVEVMTQQAILLKQSGVYSSELMDTMARIGDLASGNAQKMKSISEVYARVLSSTTVTARDMRQLANAGVPSYKALAKATDTPQGAIRSKLLKGEITSEDFQKMIKQLTDEGGLFYNAVERGAKTLMARKQNLSDSKEMAYSALGEALSVFGGTNTRNSLYGKFLSGKEDFYQMAEDFFTAGNLNVAIKDAIINVDKAVMNTKIQSLLDQLGITSTDSSYKDAVNAEVSAVYEKFISQYGSDVSNFTEDGARKIEYVMNLYNDAIKNKDIVGLDGKKLDLSKSDKQSLAEYIKESYGDVLSFYNFLGIAKFANFKSGKTFDPTQDMYYKGAELAYFDKASSFSKDYADKLLGKTDSIINLRTKAANDWDAGTYGKMLKADEEFFKNQAIKDRVLSERNKFVTTVNDDGTINLNLAHAETVDEFLQVYSDLLETADALDISLGNMLDVNGNVTKEGMENFEKFGDNLIQIAAAFNHMGGASVMGEEVYNTIQEQKEMVLNAIADEEVSEGLLVAVSDYFIKFEQGIEKAVEEGVMTADMADKLKTIYGTSRLDNTYSTKNIEKLNARQTSLWETIVGKTTGIDATRVRQLGGAKSMEYYSTNLAQRNQFNSIASSLLSSGVSLGVISEKLQRTGIGNDGTQLFNWKGSMSDIEKMASERSISTQQALVQAYESQINTLNELELAGVATTDQWSELHRASDILGSGFSLAAEKMADGSYVFTEATIKAAEEMKKEYSAKLFRESNNLLVRQTIEDVKKNMGDTNTKRLYYSGELGLGNRYLSNEDIDVLAGLSREIITSNTQKGWAGASDAINQLTGNNKARAIELFKKLTGNDLYSKATVTEGTRLLSTYADKNSPQIKALQSKFDDIYNEVKEKAYEDAFNYYSSFRSDATIMAKRHVSENAESLRDRAIDLLRQREGNNSIRVSYNGDIISATIESIVDSSREIDVAAESLNESLTDLYNNLDDLSPELQAAGVEFSQIISDTTGEFDSLGDALAKSTKSLNDMNMLLEQRVINENMAYLAGSKNELDRRNPYTSLVDVSKGSSLFSWYNSERTKAMLGLAGFSENAKFADAFALNGQRKLNMAASSTDELTIRMNMLEREAEAAYNTRAGGGKLSDIISNILVSGIEEVVEQSNLEGNSEALAPLYLGTSYNYSEALKYLKDNGYSIIDDSFLTSFTEEGNSKKVLTVGDFLAATNALTLAEQEKEAYLDGNGYLKEGEERRRERYYANEPIFDAIAQISNSSPDVLKKLIEKNGGSSVLEMLSLSGVSTEGLLDELGNIDIDKTMSLFDQLRMTMGDIGLSQLLADIDEVTVRTAYMQQTFVEFGASMVDTLKSSGMDALNGMFVKLGENSYKFMTNMATSEENSKALGQYIDEIGASLLSNIGATAANTGLNIAAAAAMQPGGPNWGLVTAGLALAATGGVANFLSGFLGAAGDGSSANDQYERLAKLKDNLADLLAQAREDAGYYEATLRDKRAVAANDSLSSITATKVNDMILTDKGVFSTDPKDTIMAMKDPASLMGPGSMSFSPNINLKFINQSGNSFAVSDIESSVNANGDIDIIATIDAAVKKGIASGEYDEAYDLMRSRRQGVVISG